MKTRLILFIFLLTTGCSNIFDRTPDGRAIKSISCDKNTCLNEIHLLCPQGFELVSDEKTRVNEEIAFNKILRFVCREN